MLNVRARAVAACLSVLALAGMSGCSQPEPPKIVPARGVVTLSGVPLAKVKVRFIPMVGFGADFIATGETDDQGRFELTCQGQPGACAVENTVLVSEADIPPELKSENKQRELAVYLRSLKNRPIPKAYATPVQSPLKVSVVEGQEEYNFQLSR